MNEKKLQELETDIRRLLFTKYGFTVGNTNAFAKRLANWVRRYEGLENREANKET